MWLRNFLVPLAACLLPSFALAEQAEPDQKKAEQHFATTVLPLLQRKCYACHANDPANFKGSFDMRSRATMLEGGESGEAGLVPGDAAASSIYQAVLWETLEMPPKENDRLTGEEIAAVAQWINAGAVWPSAERIKELEEAAWSSGSSEGVQVATSGGQSEAWTNRRYDPADLWAYQPLQHPAVPGNGAESHPIDAFLNQQLAEAGLTAAPPASPEVLVRRVSYDLTGLPPNEQLAAAYLANPSPAAWNRLVDQLLASPHYGERMAQHWLDVVRYADTDGFARDEFRPAAWKYRDYVIKAFNTDKPYDQFVREQVAGDELEAKAPAATGMLWMGPWEHTAMSVAAETRQQWLDDVTNSIGVTFLGHELRCARCHDHKFDPVPTRDYYRIQAVFASTAHNKGRGNYEIRSQKPEQVHILAGGSLESPGEQVQPGVLSVAGEVELPQSQTGRRLALAKWLASPENPLTARVMVNRVWQMHFGRGLVATPNNFGKTGSKPTHPQLLDFLASSFLERGWSVKELHRLMVTSQAYQRSSAHSLPGRVAELDPANNLLSHFTPRRLTIEEMRDSLLAITGELNPHVGGESVWPEINWEVAFQPRLLMGKVGPPYQPSAKRSERNRRTLYAVRIRGLRDPLMEAFNRPSSELSCERREISIVAPQALTMLHGEFFHDRALALSHKLAEQHAESAARITAAFESLLRREPTAEERQWAVEHLAEMTREHEQLKLEPTAVPTEITLNSVQERTGEPESKTFQLEKLKQYEQDLEAWQVDASTRALADVCLVLLNTSEFLYVY